MPILVFLIVVAIIATPWFLYENVLEKLKNTQKLLEASYKANHQTPIKELTANFREFVEGFDGQISPEIEAALKKLETDEAPKMLEASPKPVENKQKQVNEHSKAWRAFWSEYVETDFDRSKIDLVKAWTNNITFDVEEQSLIIRELDFDRSKIELRRYFNK